VQDINREAREFCLFSVCEFGSPIAFVHVAPDRGDGRDPAQRRDDGGVSDIATVDDVVDGGKETLRLRTE
jgi:hypothetical protein